MKKVLALVVLLGVLGVGSVYSQKTASVKKSAAGFNVADLLFPASININKGFITLSYERAITKKFSLYVPVSYYSLLGIINIFKLEVHPRYYLLGENLKGLFVAPYLGATIASALGVSSTYSIVFGGTAGYKFVIAKKYFVEALAGYGEITSSLGLTGGLVTGLTIGYLF